MLIDQSVEAQRDPALQAFLAHEAVPFRGGVYPQPYQDEADLRLGLTASLAALRPRGCLAIVRDGERLAGRLCLAGLHPALGDVPGTLGPFPLDLDLSPTATAALAAFLAGVERGRVVSEDALALLGGELWERMGAQAGGLLARCLDLAAEARQTLLLEVRTREPGALAAGTLLEQVGQRCGVAGNPSLPPSSRMPSSARPWPTGKGWRRHGRFTAWRRRILHSPARRFPTSASPLWERYSARCWPWTVSRTRLSPSSPRPPTPGTALAGPSMQPRCGRVAPPRHRCERAAGCALSVPRRAAHRHG